MFLVFSSLSFRADCSRYWKTLKAPSPPFSSEPGGGGFTDEPTGALPRGPLNLDAPRMGASSRRMVSNDRAHWDEGNRGMPRLVGLVFKDVKVGTIFNELDLIARAVKSFDRSG